VFATNHTKNLLKNTAQPHSAKALNTDQIKKSRLSQDFLYYVVPEERLELSSIATTASETATFTNFAIRAETDGKDTFFILICNDFTQFY
jgi:hypothetical protein